MRHQVMGLLLVGIAVGCTRDHPTASAEIQPTAKMAGRSGCYIISGLIEQTGQFPLFTGTISGDVEGTVTTQLDPSSTHTSGRVSFSTGEQTWQVTGGTVAELIGRTVRLALETEVVFAQPPLGRNNTRARVIDGAEAGNLTYHGTFAAVPPPPFAVEIEYRGVICP